MLVLINIGDWWFLMRFCHEESFISGFLKWPFSGSVASQYKYEALWITEFQNVAKVLSARKE